MLTANGGTRPTSVFPNWRREPGIYGSFTVSLQDAPPTSALFLRGSLQSRQLTLPFPLALGSGYLNRQSTSDPVAGLSETVVVKIAPAWFAMTFPEQPSGANPDPAHERMLFASPVGCQAVFPAGME